MSGSARWRSIEAESAIHRVEAPSPPTRIGTSSPATGVFTSVESERASASSELPMRCASPRGRSASSPAFNAIDSPAPVFSRHSPSITRCARAIAGVADTDTHHGARAVASSVTPAANLARRRTSERASIKIGVRYAFRKLVSGTHFGSTGMPMLAAEMRT